MSGKVSGFQDKMENSENYDSSEGNLYIEQCLKKAKSCIDLSISRKIHFEDAIERFKSDPETEL